MKIINWYIDKVETLSSYFTAEHYADDYGYSDRFPSFFSLITRFLIKYMYLLFPVLCIGGIILGIVEAAPFYQIILLMPIVAVVEAIVIAALLAFFMLIESFCKLLTGLILHGNVPAGAENPIDALLMFIIG